MWINKFNKFNNFHIDEFEINNISKNDKVKEIINYGISGVIYDLSSKKNDKDNKIIWQLISDIFKKQY